MILGGARAVIQRHKPVLIFEMWEAQWQNYKATINWLASSYDMVRLADNAPVPDVYLGEALSGVADILAVPKRGMVSRLLKAVFGRV